jgi:hypothetical protein
MQHSCEPTRRLPGSRPRILAVAVLGASRGQEVDHRLSRMTPKSVPSDPQVDEHAEAAPCAC